MVASHLRMVASFLIFTCVKAKQRTGLSRSALSILMQYNSLLKTYKLIKALSTAAGSSTVSSTGEDQQLDSEAVVKFAARIGWTPTALEIVANRWRRLGWLKLFDDR